MNPENAQIIKLRFFAGLSLEETAQAMGISRATAQRNGLTHEPGSTASCRRSADTSPREISKSVEQPPAPKSHCRMEPTTSGGAT